MLEIEYGYIQEMAKAVRVNLTETSEEELRLLISAGAAELTRRGVKRLDIDDPLTKQAIRLYCKGNYGYDKGSEEYRECFEGLANAMSLSQEYYED